MQGGGLDVGTSAAACTRLDGRGSAGVLETAGYPVDGEQEQALQALALVVLGVGVAKGSQGAELQVGQGVHVGVAERDGAGQQVPVGQQAVVAGARGQRGGGA